MQTASKVSMYVQHKERTYARSKAHFVMLRVYITIPQMYGATTFAPFDTLTEAPLPKLHFTALVFQNEFINTSVRVY